MTALACWVLITYGLTTIVTRGSIFHTLRLGAPTQLLRTLLACPLCFGFWVGFGLGFAHLGPATMLLPTWPAWASAIGDGWAASGACWIVHVVMLSLGENDA